MIAKENIVRITEDFMSGTDMFLVNVIIGSANQIDVFVDADSGVNIDTCIKLSKEIEGSLDREIEDFSLNVSSAGLDMPLVLPRQYKKFIGKELEILGKDGIKYQALLLDATDDFVRFGYKSKELIEGKKRKQLVDKELQLAYSDIKTTFVIISFK